MAIKKWTKEERAIAADAIGEDGCRGALGEIFAHASSYDIQECQDIATRAMSELKHTVPKKA